MDLVAVVWRAFLAAVEDDFLPSSVVLDVAVAILTVQVIFHRAFHALDSAMIEIGEADNMTQHRAIRINTAGVALEINATQILRA